jgi:hypothetical protein
MRKLYILLLTFFVSFVVNAQISITVTGNANTTPNLQASYGSLAAALTDLNAVSAMSGPVTLTCAGGGSETAPATGFTIGSATLNPVLSSTNTVTINTSGGTATINAGVGTSTPASAAPDGILKLVGADYITIDGLTFTDGNTTNPASMEFGVGLFKGAVGDGCNNNTIQNCIFNMQRVNNVLGTAPMIDGSVGILMINSTATAATTALAPTAAVGANSNNKFYSNTINGGNYGMGLIGFAGSSPFTACDFNNDIGGNSIATGNIIQNFGGGAATNPSAGIRTLAQYSINVSYNIVNNNTGSNANHATTLRGIYLNTATSANATINNNTLTLKSGATTSTCTAIDNQSGSTAAGNTISISNNTISGANTAATSGVWIGIQNGSSAATVNINGNTMTGFVLDGTGTHVMIETGSPTTATANNNTITNITRTSLSGSWRIIKTTSPTNFIANGNTIDGLSYTAATSTGGMDGIYSFTNAVNVTANNNIIRNLSIPTTGTIRGIMEFGITGLKTFQNNQIYNFSTTAGGAGGASFTGITESTGSTNDISGNKIYSFNSTGGTGGTGGTIVGITFSGGTTNNVYKNKIYDLSSNSTGTTVSGISVAGGTTNNIYNNLIGDLRATASTSLVAVNGIQVTGGSTVNITYNTINISATSSSTTTFGTNALYVSSLTPNVTSRNNIWVNTSATGPTGGITAAFRYSATPTSYTSASNNNLFYAGAPSATHLIYVEGTTTIANGKQTLSDYQTYIGGGKDGSSISEDPSFASTSGSSSDFLHITPGATTAIESGGVNVSGISNDFDGDIRAGNAGYTGTSSTADIGADEFEGVPTGTPCDAPSDQASGLSFGTATTTTQPGSFTAAGSNPSGYLIVRSVGPLSTSPVNGTGYSTGNPIGNGIVVQSGTAIVFTASALTGNTNYTYTIFSYNSGGCIGGPVYNLTTPLSDSSITCPATPTALSTSNVNAGNFQLNWTSSKGGGANAITYNLEVTTDAAFATPITGSPFTVNDNTTMQTVMSYTVTGLSPATIYYYRLKANGCNIATVTGNVTTACNALTLPINEGFNTSGSTILPTCWSQQFVVGTSALAFNTSSSFPTTSPYEGTRFVYWNSFTITAGNKTRLVSPVINASGISSIDAEFYWKNENNSSYNTGNYVTGEGVTVQYSIDNGATWINVQYVPRHDGALGVSTSLWNKKTITLPAGAGNQANLLVGFEFVSALGDNSAMDAVNIQPTPTTPCAAPVDQATALTFGTQGTTTLPGSFTAAASAPAGYLVIRSVGALNTMPVDGTTYLTGNALGNGIVLQSGAGVSFTATGLTGNTDYTFTVFAYNNTSCLGGPAYNTSSALTGNASTCPVTPTGLSASNQTSTSFRINWTSSKGGGVISPIDYTVEVATDAAFTTPVTGSPFTVTDNTTMQTAMSYTVTGLNATTLYYYKIKASGCNAVYTSNSSTTTLGAPPANDEATGALTLTVGAGCTGATYTNVNATLGTNEVSPTCASTPQAPVWFSFVAPANGAVRVSTDLGSGNTLTDSRIALFSTTNVSDYSTFSQLVCDEDGGSTSGNMSVLYSTGLTPGTIYYIAVEKYASSTPAGTFCIAVDELTSAMLSTSNTCTSTFQTPFGSNSSYKGWVPLLDGSSRLIALVRNPAGGEVDDFIVKQNINTGAVRQSRGIYYLGRNYMINNATATNVDIQFFFLDTELAALNAADGTTINTLGVTKQTNGNVSANCYNNFATVNGSSSFLTQAGNGASGGISWIQVNTPTFSNFYLNRVGAVLPANLLTFSGVRQGNSNNLKWTVAQEVDVQNYEVERSNDGRSWSAAGSVNSLGNTSTQRSYTFSDNNISGVKQFYRLRLVDRNGSEKLSNTVIISGVKPTALTLSGLFPNPTASKLNVLIDAPAKDNITITVMDGVGRIVKTQRMLVDAGSNTLELNVANLAAGSYLLKVSCDSNCQSAVNKFIKE